MGYFKAHCFGWLGPQQVYLEEFLGKSTIFLQKNDPRYIKFDTYCIHIFTRTIVKFSILKFGVISMIRTICSQGFGKETKRD